MGKILSFNGRVRRMGFWISSIVLSTLNAIFYTLFYQLAERADPGMLSTLLATLFILMLFVLSLIGLSISVRRWHDLNKSGWWVLISFIPLVGALYSLVELGFVGGDNGPNSYGPPPTEGAIL